MQRQIQGVFHGALGQVVEVALAVQDGAPEGAQQHVLDIGEELGQNDAPPRDLGPVEKQGVDHAAGDGSQHIAGEIGVTAGGQEEAEGILGGAEHDHRQRAADQRAKGSGQKGNAEGQALAQTDGAVAQDDTGGDHQGHEHQTAQSLQLPGGAAPVAGGQGMGIKRHKKTSSDLADRTGRTAAQRSAGAYCPGDSRYAAAGCGTCTARRCHFVRRTTPRSAGTVPPWGRHADPYSAFVCVMGLV